MWATALVTGVWGGLLALERRAFLQAALSRPLPAACGVGALLGDVQTGLMVGLVFELLHLGGASLGGAHPDHDTVPAVTATGFAASLAEGSGSHATPALWACAILLWAPTGALGRLVDTALDARARRYFGRLVDAVDAGKVERALRQNLRAMWPHFAAYALLSGAAVVTGRWLSTSFAGLPVSLARGLAWTYPILGTISAAAAVHASQGQGRLRIAAVAGLVVAVLFLGTLGARAW